MIRRGHLSDLFTGVVAKKLTLVEVDHERSNQHEFQGTAPFRRLFGAEDRTGIPTRFILIEDEQATISEDGFVSWSNVRKGRPRAPEFHLYYSSNPVTKCMEAGDVLFLAMRRDQSIVAIIAPSSSTIQNQLVWLFGLSSEQISGFKFEEFANAEGELDFVARCILDELGIEAKDQDGDELDEILEKFQLTFPSTRVFSQTARESLPDVSPLDGPDDALMLWMEREEHLFRRMERRVIHKMLHSGFVTGQDVDVDGFLSFSLSVQNRRKSRRGFSLENHIQAIFDAVGLRYSRAAITENGFKPDFLFPGQVEYRAPDFPAGRLTMLGAKSTLKDRWRQVLSEAARIPIKHLITLEPGISEAQTRQIADSGIQLVIPEKLQETFLPRQRPNLQNVSEFLSLVRDRQSASP